MNTFRLDAAYKRSTTYENNWRSLYLTATQTIDIPNNRSLIEWTFVSDGYPDDYRVMVAKTTITING